MVSRCRTHSNEAMTIKKRLQKVEKSLFGAVALCCFDESYYPKSVFRTRPRQIVIKIN